MVRKCKNVEDAIKLALEVKKTFKFEDFNLHGFRSYAKEFLNSLGKEIHFKLQGKVTIGENELADKKKVLGVVWKPPEDVFTIDSSNIEQKPPTLRGITSRVATVFDPMGFAYPITVKVKIQL